VILGTYGAYGTMLMVTLSRTLRAWGNLTGISMTLSRRFSFHGKRRSYLSAGCPAPKGVSIVSFPFARASFGFDGGQTVTSTLVRSCKATPSR
jgi:hypothetical protein